MNYFLVHVVTLLKIQSKNTDRVYIFASIVSFCEYFPKRNQRVNFSLKTFLTISEHSQPHLTNGNIRYTWSFYRLICFDFFMTSSIIQSFFKMLQTVTHSLEPVKLFYRNNPSNHSCALVSRKSCDIFFTNPVLYIYHAFQWQLL